MTKMSEKIFNNTIYLYVCIPIVISVADYKSLMILVTEMKQDVRL